MFLVWLNWHVHWWQATSLWLTNFYFWYLSIEEMSRSFLSGGLNLNNKQLIKSIKENFLFVRSESFINANCLLLPSSTFQNDGRRQLYVALGIFKRIFYLAPNSKTFFSEKCKNALPKKLSSVCSWLKYGILHTRWKSTFSRR